MGSISNKNLGEDSKQALSKEAVEHPTTISVPNSAQTNKAEASKTLHKRVGSDGYLTDELVNELGVTSETHGINTITPLNRHKRADSSDYVTNEMIKKLGNISDLEASNVDGHQLQTDSVLKLLREQEHEDSTKEVRENSNEPDRFLSVEDHWKTCIYPDVLRCLDELMLEHVSIGLELFLTYRSAKYDAYKKRIYSHIFNLELTHKDFFKQKTAYENTTRLVGSEMSIRDSAYSTKYPVAPEVVCWEMIYNATSLGVTPSPNCPFTLMRIFLGLGCMMHWVDKTISTSEVPIPKAIAPKAPCVDVCESPQTMVAPGRVIPFSGPTI